MSASLSMDKKFEVNWTNIKGGCQSYTKAPPQQSWSDLTLIRFDVTSARNLSERKW